MKVKNERIRFNKKTPHHKGRATFAIVWDSVTKGGTRSSRTIQDERLDAINIAYKAGKPIDECSVLVSEIVADLYKQEAKKNSKVVHNSENLKLVDDYFVERYKPRKIRESSKVAMYHDLVRAVEAVGHLSLYSASGDEIQTQVDRYFKEDSQRRIIMRLRQLLRFISRHDVRLHLDYPTDRQVKYVEVPDEIKMILEKFKEDRVMHCLISIGAFAGLRQSEIFGIQKHQIKRDNLLLVDTQLLPDGTRRKPKGNKIRDAYVIGEGMAAVREWLTIPADVKEAYRKGKSRIPNAIKKVCKKLWPNDFRKHLNFHDTRHCYGVYLVSIAIPTDILAKSMGNSPEVCRKHYQGFMMSETAIDTIAAIVQKRG